MTAPISPEQIEAIRKRLQRDYVDRAGIQIGIPKLKRDLRILLQAIAERNQRIAKLEADARKTAEAMDIVT